MAFKYQLRDLRASAVRVIAGVCPDSVTFVQMANEVQRRLMKRGNWYDTEWLVRLCVYNRCITWPRYVGTVLGTRTCNGMVGSVKNRWFDVIGGAYSMPKSFGGGTFGPDGYGLFDSPFILVDGNPAPTYNTVSGTTGKYLRYYVKYQNDIGKTITIYGKKYGGEPLMHFDTADNTWKPGLILTAAAPYATSAVLVTEIHSVVREATQGEARLYEYDATTDLLRDLALYEPNETNPRYRTSVITNWCDLMGCKETTTVDGTEYQRDRATIEILCKLEHFDLVNDYDFLLIDDFDAFKLGFQAIKLEEMNEDQAAEIKWQKAVRELNFTLEDKNPDSQIPVAINVVNGPTIYSPY